MALWGNKDSKSATGTVSIADTGVVTGSSTLFTTEAKVGNYIKAGGVDYQIISITSDTVAKVIMGKNNGNGTVTTASGASYTLSEKPAFVAHESADSGYGKTGDANKVFGVDTTEAEYGGEVVNLQIATAGSGYKETPTVVIANTGSTQATATATISGGAVTALTITARGDGYTATPTVSIDVPRRTIATSAVTVAADTITYTAHGLTTGDRVKYYKVGAGTAIAGLTDATTYYAIVVDANTFKVATSAANATAGTAVDLTGTGNNAQYFDLLDQTTATANATLSSGTGGSPAVAHSGWVRRTVGTGGRAGRVFYETLVANGTSAATAGDQADDAVLPEA
jgi:hypothetical protein